MRSDYRSSFYRSNSFMNSELGNYINNVDINESTPEFNSFEHLLLKTKKESTPL